MPTALVTGASRGIGRAIATRFAQDGHDVAVGYAASAGAAEQLAAELRALGRRAIAAGADLADAGAVDRLVDAVEDALGPLDILVANAGVNTPGRRVEEISLEEWDRLHAVNLRAPFLLARRVMPGMAERGFGRIVLLSSVAAYTGGIIGAPYPSSKAGLPRPAPNPSPPAPGGSAGAQRAADPRRRLAVGRERHEDRPLGLAPEAGGGFRGHAEADGRATSGGHRVAGGREAAARMGERDAAGAVRRGAGQRDGDRPVGGEAKRAGREGDPGGGGRRRARAGEVDDARLRPGRRVHDVDGERSGRALPAAIRRRGGGGVPPWRGPRLGDALAGRGRPVVERPRDRDRAAVGVDRLREEAGGGAR